MTRFVSLFLLLMASAVEPASAQQPVVISSARLWMALLILLPVLTAAAMAGLKTILLRKSGVTAARGFIQLTSLALCTTAIWLMLRLLEVMG